MALLQLIKLKLFLLLTTLSFCCQAYNNSTVKVVGLIHCTHNCGINNHSTTTTTTHASNLGLDVFIICKARKSSETKTQGNGGVDEHGKFNVTLADPTSIDGCYAKLQSSNSSSAPNCPIQGPQTASLKILSNKNRPTTVIEFSPITCQSAFFWPFPNLTFFASPPPQPQNIASPVQPPEPSYDDPPSPSPPPPTPPPTYQNLPTPTASPQAPPPLPETSPPLEPPVNNPVQSPTPPESPTPALSPPSLLPPSRRRPNPIPRAPPIPRLPVTPSVPRKYFNAPKSKSKPPRYD